jgi:predicted PurR-regulated permease PerM
VQDLSESKYRLVKEKRSLVIFLLCLMAAFGYMMQPFLMPAFLSFIIVVLLYPGYRRLTQRMGHKPRLAAFVATLVIFTTLIVPSGLVATIIINQALGLLNALDVKAIFGDLFSTDIYNQYVLPYVVDFETQFHIKLDIFDWLTKLAKEAASYVYNFSPQVLLGTATIVFDFFIMMAMIYFLFLEGPRLLRVLFDLSPLREKHEQKLSAQFQNMIQATVFGYFVTAFVQAILAGIGFAISGLSALSVVLGTLTFFMSMVPIIGAAGVWIPVAVWFFLKGETGWGIFHLIYGGLLISGIDNFIKPLIIQGRTHIHPLLIFFSLLGGVTLFGPLGILFGPVITALLFATIKIYREEFA